MDIIILLSCVDLTPFMSSLSVAVALLHDARTSLHYISLTSKHCHIDNLHFSTSLLYTAALSSSGRKKLRRARRMSELRRGRLVLHHPVRAVSVPMSGPLVLAV